MKFKRLGQNYLLRLEKGELIMETLEKFFSERQIHPAWLQGIGAAQWVEVGAYNPAKKNYTWRRFDQTLEINSLVGNVIWVDNHPFIHIHGGFSDQSMQTYGGHLKEASISATCEIYIVTFDEAISRKQSDEIGLKLLDL